MSALSSGGVSGIAVAEVDDEVVGRRLRWLKRLRRTLELGGGGWRVDDERDAMMFFGNLADLGFRIMNEGAMGDNQKL